MNPMFEFRQSDSPYISMIWRGRTGPNYTAMCPANTQWHILLSTYQGKTKVSIEGPLTQAMPKVQPEGLEFFGVKFKLGIFMPYVPVQHLLDSERVLPHATERSFWLNGDSWEIPTYDHLETFVDHLVHDEVLLWDPVVSAIMQDQPHDLSFRTARRRFLLSTGLTQKTIQQIERANQAVALLEGGMSILDTVYELGYADQPHMTRSLKHYIGFTPAQIIRATQPQIPENDHFIQDVEPLAAV